MSLLAGVFLGVLWRTEKEVQPIAKSVQRANHRTPATQPAAYLMSANGCNWGRSGPAVWNVGHSVQAGDEVALNEGVAEFRLASGAYLGAEGPASLLLASPSTLVLQYGKLTSHVPWGSNELKIVAAGCRIIARDAEFGLSYSNNKLDIHVFSGQVTADSLVAQSSLKDTAIVDGDWATVDGDNCFTDAVITAGRVLQLTVQGELLKVAGWNKAKPSDFINKLSMSGPLNVTQAYVDQVLASQPIGYWRFEKIVDSTVPNEIPAGPALKVRKEPSLDGSRQNFSADFYPNSKFYLVGERELPLANCDYTIEAWVKPSHLHLGSIATLSDFNQETNSYSGVRLELEGARNESYQHRHPGWVRFHHYRDYHRDANNKATNTGTSCYSASEYSMRRWQHLVAVKCGADMKLFVNGKLPGWAQDATVFPNSVKLTVGLESDRHSRKFVGQIDELAIYSRALPKQEISKHYKLLKDAMSSPGSSRPRTTRFSKTDRHLGIVSTIEMGRQISVQFEKLMSHRFLSPVREVENVALHH